VCVCVCVSWWVGGIILLSQGIITWLVSFLLIGRENWKRQERVLKLWMKNTWRETEEGSEWNRERERERDWLNPAQWKRGSTFTPFRGLTGKERESENQSDIVFSQLKRNMSNSILRRHSSKKGLDNLKR